MKKIVMLLAIACMGFAAPAAHADQGDWWTQRQTTQRFADADCRAVYGCYAVGYRTSGVSTEHSRTFFWNLYTHYGCSVRYYKISHSYNVWDQGWWGSC